MRKTLLGFALLTFAALLTGCGDSGAEPATHNAADIEFAQQMVPHHEQALEMAALATTRTDNDAVLELAGEISSGRRDPRSNSSTPGWRSGVPSLLTTGIPGTPALPAWRG